MTIFLMVLKKLIKEDLRLLSENLRNQSQKYGYNKDLSLDQKEIIDELEVAVFKLNQKNDDLTDYKAIEDLIKTYRSKDSN